MATGRGRVDDGNDEVATNLPTLRYAKLNSNVRNLERHGHGFILRSSEVVELAPFGRARIRTDIQIKLPSRQYIGRITALPTEDFRLSTFNSGLMVSEAIVEPEQIMEILRVTVINLSGTTLVIALGEAIAKLTVEESPKMYCLPSHRLNNNTLTLIQEAGELSHNVFVPIQNRVVSERNVLPSLSEFMPVGGRVLLPSLSPFTPVDSPSATARPSPSLSAFMPVDPPTAKATPSV